MSLKIFVITLSVLIFLTIIELARREKISFKYAIGWIVIALLAIFFEIFHDLLFELARWFGFTLPSNFIFFILLTSFVFWSLFLTMFLCQQNQRNNTMAQKIGMLELELKTLKRQDNQGGGRRA
jgi:hypothetical protein